MENGKVLLFLIFNIHPVVSAAVFALVMDIVAVDRPVAGLLMAAAQAAEIGVVITPAPWHLGHFTWMPEVRALYALYVK